MITAAPCHPERSEGSTFRRFGMSHVQQTRSLVAALLGMTALLPLHAQLRSFNPLPGKHDVYSIRNASVVTVTGPTIERGTVVIGRDGKIQAVGANVTIPAGAQTLDGTGLFVYPGMMDAATTMGLSEIGQGAIATVDAYEVGSFNPNASAFGLNEPTS